MDPTISPVRRKMGRIVSSVVVAVIVVYVGYVIYAVRPVHLSPEDARNMAREAVARVGGAGKICEEAGQIFERFGVSELNMLDDSDLKDYPAIAALGNWAEIEPYGPAFLRIFVGTHQKNYHILIFESGVPDSFYKRETLQLDDSCMFIYR